MSEFRNEFSWSKSRDEIFLTCPRQYYFSYYAYWGGWEQNAPERTRQIYILKNLKNQHLWGGDTVHQCIKHTLKNLQRGIAVLDVDEIISITINKMRDDFRSSKSKRYLMYPKSCALFEHEYDMDLPNAEWKKVAEDVEQCLRNFYGSEIFFLMKDLPQEKWLEIENFSYFYLDGIKIWAVLDCSFQTDDGVTIIDWKTGSVNWSTQPRLLIIAQDFDIKELSAINLMGPSVELKKFSLYDGLFNIEDVNIVKRTPPPPPDLVGPGSEKYTLDQLLKKASPEIREIMLTLREKTLGISDAVWEKVGAFYCDYRTSSTFTSIQVRKNKLKVFIKMGDQQVDDPQGICKPVPETYGYGLLNTLFDMSKKELMESIQQTS